MKVASSGGNAVMAALAASMLALATGIATVVALALGLVLVSALFSGEARAQAVATPSAASPLLSVMQGLVGLVIVIGVIYLVGWLLKKTGPRVRSGGLVQVVGGASVGPRERVVVVRFEGRTLLLGVAPGQVSLLQATEGTATIDPVASDPTTPRFIDRLRAARSGT